MWSKLDPVALQDFFSNAPNLYDACFKKKKHFAKTFVCKFFFFIPLTEETKQKISFTVKEKKQIVLGAPRLIKISDVTQVSFNPDSKFFFSGTTFIYFG